MVNVGLKAFLWHSHKTAEQRIKREVCQLNGCTYKAYRAWIEKVKESGFLALGVGNDQSRPWRQAASSACQTPFSFRGMVNVFAAGESSVSVLQFGAGLQSWLAWGSMDGSVRIAGGKEPFSIMHEVFDHKTAVLSLASSPDGTLLLSTAQDGGVCLRQADSGALVRTFLLSGTAATGCAFQQYNPNFVMVGSSAGIIHVLNCSIGSTQEQVELGQQSHGGISAIAAAGNMLFAADANGAVFTFRCEVRGAMLRPLQRLFHLALPGLRRCAANNLMYTGISCLAAGPALLATHPGTTVSILRVNVKSGALDILATAKTPDATCNMSAKFCPPATFDGPDFIAMGGGDTQVHILAMSGSNLKVVNRIQGHLAAVVDTAWTPDGQMLASCDTSGVVILWRREIV